MPYSFFLLLNTYNDGGPYSWSVQLNFNLSTGLVTNDMSSPVVSQPILYDQWVEIRVDGRRQPMTLVTETLPTARAHRVEVLEDLEVITVDAAVRSEQGIRSESGALITGISAALSQNLGLREGDVLLGINNARINTAEDAAETIRTLQRGARVRIFFERNGAISYLDFYTRR